MTSPATQPLEWVLAPLAGYTDVAFRRGCQRHGCRFAYTPLIDACALVYGNRHNREILARGEGEEWLGVQLLGCDPAMMARAAALLAVMPFDAIDINMGCPVGKVMRKGAGAALPLDPDLALRCVDAVRDASHGRALSVKLRILSAEDPGPTVTFCRRLEAAGVGAVTIHGRVWQRIYSGPVAGRVIRAVGEALRIPVTANGGIFSRADGLRLAQATGCRTLMVARGAIGNPWIFRELTVAGAPPPSHEEVCAALREHIEGMVPIYGEGAALREGRKIILAYLCGRGYRRSLRASVSGVCTMADFDVLFNRICAEAPPESPTPYRHRPPLEVLG
jgi:nifR3 family TIM-barrel protein